MRERYTARDIGWMVSSVFNTEVRGSSPHDVIFIDGDETNLTPSNLRIRSMLKTAQVEIGVKSATTAKPVTFASMQKDGAIEGPRGGAGNSQGGEGGGLQNVELLLQRSCNEEWRDLPQVKMVPKGKYQVSNFGRVRHSSGKIHTNA